MLMIRIVKATIPAAIGANGSGHGEGSHLQSEKRRQLQASFQSARNARLCASALVRP